MNPRNSTMWTRLRKRPVNAARLVCALLACHAGTVAAQALPNTPGLTRLQQPVAAAVQTVCGALRTAGTSLNASGTSVERLFTSCSKMVQSANYNQGLTTLPTYNPAYNLNISNAQIGTAVQAIAPVQANSQKKMSNEAAKMNAIGARLLDVRGGAHGLILGYNGLKTPLAGGSVPDDATGGAASADDVVGGRWGGFVNVAYGWGNVDQTTLQDPYKYDSVSILAGADYRVGDSVVLGGALSYSDTSSRYELGLGEVKARTTGVVGYGTWFHSEWFVDGFVSYGSIDYDSKRIINIPSNNAASTAAPMVTAATARPKGDQISAALSLGRTLTRGRLNVAPAMRVGYISVDNKAFSETEPVDGLALAVNERTIHSLQSALGAKFSTTVSTAGAVLVPYLNLQWLHEFANDSPSIVSKYVADPTNQFFAIPTADPTSNYGVVAVGTSATFPHNVSGFAQFSAAVGMKNESNYGVVLGLRKQF